MDRDHVDDALGHEAALYRAVAESGQSDRTMRVRVLVWQARAGNAPPEPRVLLIEPGLAAHVPCDNPSCRGGGLDPAPLVRELIDADADELRVSSCEGRFDPAGNGRGARCDTMFCVSLAAASHRDE